jgi:hypothetical protein
VLVQVPPACPLCRGNGVRLTLPRRCPRYLEASFLNLVSCEACGGDGRADASSSDTELVQAWESGGGFQVPVEARELPPKRVDDRVLVLSQAAENFT